MVSPVEALVPFPLVWLAGTGRSGTTWLGKILDSSPHLFYKGQPDDRSRYPWFRGIPSRLEPTGEFDGFRSCFARALVAAFWNHSPFLNPRPDFPKVFLHRTAWWAFANAMRARRKIRPERVFYCRMPRWMLRVEPQHVPLVVKSVVSNLSLAWIHKHFPGVKTILLIRHPAGYLNSIFKGAAEHRWPDIGKKDRLSGTILPFSRSEHLRYAATVDQGSDLERELIYWIVANETPILDLAHSPGFKVVVYEKLCAHPAEVTQDIFSFLGIPFGKQTEDFIRTSTSQERPGYYAVYKDPLRSAGKWREELAKEHVTVIDEYLQQSSLKSFWDSNVLDMSANLGK